MGDLVVIAWRDFPENFIPWKQMQIQHGASQIFKQIGHCRIQPSGNYLQGNDSRFTFSQLNIRNMAPIHIEMDGHVNLRPSLLSSQGLDSFSQSD